MTKKLQIAMGASFSFCVVRIQRHGSWADWEIPSLRMGFISSHSSGKPTMQIEDEAENHKLLNSMCSFGIISQDTNIFQASSLPEPISTQSWNDMTIWEYLLVVKAFPIINAKH